MDSSNNNYPTPTPHGTPDTATTGRTYLHATARQGTDSMPQQPVGSRPTLSHNTSPSQVAAQPQQHIAQPQTHQAATTPYVQNEQTAYDWQQYHAAWQRYYQQYYAHYYAQQLQAHREQLSREADEAKPTAPGVPEATITGSDNIKPSRTRFQHIRANLLAKVKERAKKLKGSNHFIPAISALIVGSIFLTLQYNRVVAAQIQSFVGPSSTVNVSDTFIADPAANTAVGTEPKLIIPKINVDVPVVYDVTTVDENQIQAGLEKGVVRYNLSGANSLPGQIGNMVVLGHSSNDMFDPGTHKFTFVLLERLQTGDVFYMHHEGKRYAYKVSEKKIIKPTEWKILQENSGKPRVILVACTPTGTAQNRLLIYGEQISPDPATAAAAPAAAQETNPARIPGNSPTFFERLWNILF